MEDKNRPSLRFSLVVNSQEQDGFRLSVMAFGEKELQLARELTEKLIEKITKIEVSVKNYYEE